MEESCCQSSSMRERSQRRRALGRGSGWQMRFGKWVLAKAATDSRWRLKPRRVSSSSATSWKLGGFWRGMNSLMKAVGGISGVNGPAIELTEDLLKKQVGETFGDLLFL